MFKAYDCFIQKSKLFSGGVLSHLVMWLAPVRRINSADWRFAGPKARDRLIFDLAREHQAAVATVFAGGYSRDANEAVIIHCNTVKAAAACL